MPVKPLFEWEQSETHIIIRVTIKGFKKEAVDVFISDTFIKVNAQPTYLLTLDLCHSIIVEKSSFWSDMPQIKITLTKETADVWETLCVDPKTPHAEIQERRAAALTRAEKLYNTKLDTREKQKEIEKKRMFREHWDIEKKVRQTISEKIAEERRQETQDLQKWQETISTTPKDSIFTPADIAASAAPPRRGGDGQTKNYGIDFTPSSQTLPQRSRGDEDYYRKSRYKPVSVEDAPMFWKDRADKLYKARDWRGAMAAYSESIKRDGSFLTCVANRAACHLRLHDYEKCVEDCDLALTILSNTPASDTTQERYRYVLKKLYIRRGAAYCWSGNTNKGLEDMRTAEVYRGSEIDEEVTRDVGVIEAYNREHAIKQYRDPVEERRNDANRKYMKGNYQGAVDDYCELLEQNEFDVKSRSNLCAAYLQMGNFQSALHEAEWMINFCKEVASALSQPGAQSSSLMDSDDEEECEDEMMAKRQEAARTIRDRSGHVYLLLKAYVRAGAAQCGLKNYRAAVDYFTLGLRITPYDDDLRDDANRIIEKLRMDTIISAAKPEFQKRMEKSDDNENQETA